MSDSANRLDAARAVIGFALAESVRRRVFAVVLVLTVIFLALYALGAHFAFSEVERLSPVSRAQVEERTVAGATVFGLALFAILFLAAVLAVFLTIGVVRGDAERGLLQPLVVRPLGRGTMLVARYLGAAAATVLYVLAVYALALGITAALGDWTPDHVLLPGIALAVAAALIAALSVLASVFMTSTAQGIAVFMVFGAGLVAGLLGQIGEALGSRSLDRIADVSAWLLPFEALYQQALYLLTSEQVGLTGVVVDLGPFGGAERAGPGLAVWALVYGGAAIALAVAAFNRRDL